MSISNAREYLKLKAVLALARRLACAFIVLLIWGAGEGSATPLFTLNSILQANLDKFIGIEFNVATNTIVGQLGVIDVNNNGVLAANTVVAIYSVAPGSNSKPATYITSATVSAGTAGRSIGARQAFFTSITPVILTPGNYVILSEAGVSGEGFGGGGTSMTFRPGTSYVNGWFSGNNTTFQGVGVNIQVTNQSGGNGQWPTALFDSAETLAFAVKAGGASPDGGTAVAVDSSGSSYVTGSFQTSATFGSGAGAVTITAASAAPFTEMFLAKYDGGGNLLWAQKAGGVLGDQGNGISVDGSGNVYVTGFFQRAATFGLAGNQITLTAANDQNDIFVAKYDTNGNLQWVQKAGGTDDDRGQSISIDSAGNSYVTGFFKGTATFGTVTLTAPTTDTAVFVAKYDTNGVLQWAQQAGSGIGRGLGIAADSSGNSHITGFFSGTMTFGSSGNQVSVTSAGGVDAFVAKFNSSGAPQWLQRAGAGSTLNDQGNSIAVDSSGNAYVTGSFQSATGFAATFSPSVSLTSVGGNDIFVAKYNSAGALLWARRDGGTSDDNAAGIALDSFGNSFVVGNYQGTASFGSSGNTVSLPSAGSTDIFIAKYDTNGNFVTVNQFGSTGFDGATAVAVDGAGSAYVTGGFSQTVNFATGGTVNLAANGNPTDIFLAKYGKLGQTITFGALGGKNLGEAAFNVSATASSNLTVSFGASGPCTVNGTLVTITGAGSCTITASQAGDVNYGPAPNVARSFNIGKATPVITWNNPQDISQGTALSSTQLNATVTFNGSNVSGTFNYNPGLGTVLALGNNQQLTLDFTPVPNTNFNTPAQKVVSINVVDTTPPTVVSIVRANASPTNAGSVSWTVTFSENVSGVEANDFTLAQGGGLSGAAINPTVTGSNNIYTVTANTGSGSGTLGLNLVDDDSIKDGANNPNGGAGNNNGNFTGEVYTIDKTAPDTNITSGPTGTITVNTAAFQFSATEANSTFECSLDNAVFSPCTSGITYNSLTNAVHTFAVRAIDPLGNGDGSPASQTFTVNVDTTPPTVLSIARANTNPTNANSVSWTVTFSENVTGVDASDFALAASGVSGAGILSITPSAGPGSVYTVTAATGTGNGTLGLNLSDNDSIKDGVNNLLGGTGNNNGNFTGEVYTLTGPRISASQGASITATWSGITIPTARDWIALYSAAGTQYLWLYVSCSQTAGASRASGSCGLPVPANAPSGTYELRLYANDSYTLLAKSVPITVGGPALPVVTIQTTVANAAEPATNGQFTVSRTGSTTNPLTVNFTVGGTATPGSNGVVGSDYVSIGTSVTIPVNAASVTIPVTVLDDNISEASETVIVTLSNNANYTVGSLASAAVNIADNDGPTLAYAGKQVDRIGLFNHDLNPDGRLDPAFTVTIPGTGSTRTITALRLDSTLGGIWDTNSSTPYSILAVASTFNGALLNNPVNDSVSIAVPATGISFVVIASDWYLGQPFPNGLFLPGQVFTLTITYSDNTTQQASVTLP